MTPHLPAQPHRDPRHANAPPEPQREGEAPAEPKPNHNAQTDASTPPKPQREGEAPAEPKPQPHPQTQHPCNPTQPPTSQPGSAGASPSLPQRKHPAHGVRFHPHRPTIVFVTVCTKDRRAWLATDDHHALLRRVWTDAAAWLTGRYVIMPDHIHLFAAPGELDISLDDWVKYWKSRFTQSHECCKGRWHPDHWDRRLRKLEDYDARWDYVRANPVRHGLVSTPQDWPFQGEIHQLDWW